MDRLDPERRLAAVVSDLEQPEVADDLRAEILQHEALVAVIGPGVAQYPVGVAAAGNVREILAVFVLRLKADALDVAHHRKAQRVRIEPAEARVVEARL